MRCVGAHEVPATAVRTLELTTGTTQLGAGLQAENAYVHESELSLWLCTLVCSAV